MPNDFPAIDDIKEKLNQKASSITQYIITPSNTQQVARINYRLYIDVISEAKLEWENEITDYYSEDGTTLNNNINQRASRFNIRGFISELKFDPGFREVIGQTTAYVSNKLSLIDAYLPGITPGVNASITQIAVAAQNAVDYVYGTLDTAADLFDTFKKKTPINKRQVQTYLFLEGLRGSLITVTTPWKRFDNMVIEFLNIMHGEENNFVSEISITFKEFRLAKTITVNQNPDNYRNRGKVQVAEIVNKGSTKGIDLTPKQSEGFLVNILDSFR